MINVVRKGSVCKRELQNPIRRPYYGTIRGEIKRLNDDWPICCCFFSLPLVGRLLYRHKTYIMFAVTLKRPYFFRPDIGSSDLIVIYLFSFAVVKSQPKVGQYGRRRWNGVTFYILIVSSYQFSIIPEKRKEKSQRGSAKSFVYSPICIFFDAKHDECLGKSKAIRYWLFTNTGSLFSRQLHVIGSRIIFGVFSF